MLMHTINTTSLVLVLVYTGKFHSFTLPLSPSHSFPVLLLSIRRTYTRTRAWITVTTVGYGDKVPKTLWGQVWTVIVLVIGIILINLVTGMRDMGRGTERWRMHD